MTLQEMNNKYDEFILTEEYLIEGLRIFKESNKLYNFANIINKKAIGIREKDPESYKVFLKTAEDTRALADKYKAVEDAFASKIITKKEAIDKLKELKVKNEELLKYIKSENTSCS